MEKRFELESGINAPDSSCKENITSTEEVEPHAGDKPTSDSTATETRRTKTGVDSEETISSTLEKPSSNSDKCHTVSVASSSSDEHDSHSKDLPSSGEPMDPSTLHYEGETCIYTDPKSKHQYQWDSAKHEWVPREASSTYGFDGDTHTYTDPSDGTVYMWDKDKNAWFPKIDDDFMAVYQMNYGFTDPKVAAEEAAKAEKAREEKERLEIEKKLKRKAEPQPPTWFELDNEHNTKVYVSNLPLDISEQEFVDLMQKCGMVMREVDSNKWKVKLYTEPGNPTQLKGDALCTYIKVESVDLALNLLDGYEIKGKKISVERAKFQLKGSYDPSLKPKKKRKKDKEKLKKQQEKMFDWRPEKMRGERPKNERVVIIKNLFDPKDFERDVSLILEYQQDLREECSKCGDVRKVVVYDRHAEGVAQVTFSDAEEADICLKLLNGRWFGQRKITAETWDGETRYKVIETEAQTKARLEKWDKFLDSDESKGPLGGSDNRMKMSDLEEATGGGEDIPSAAQPEADVADSQDSASDPIKAINNGSG